MGWRRRKKIRKGLRGTYVNPAAAVGICKRRGNKTPGEIYECAIGAMPRGPREDVWAREAKRLARVHGTLDGKRKRRK